MLYDLTDCFVVSPCNDEFIGHHGEHAVPVGGARNYFHRIVMIFLLAFSTLIVPQYGSAQSTIKIGFIIREADDHDIQAAAQKAVDDANAKGAYDGRMFELITKTCDGPWGTTSKQAVSLIYDDEVPILVTAVDGRNAHLVEQVAAKSHIVMLSTLSSDPTLSRAYVPWYFRIVPDDRQQAKVLVKQIYADEKAKKVAIISLDDYDGVKSVAEFVSEAKEKGYPEPYVFSNTTNSKELEKISNDSWDILVFAGLPKNEAELIKSISGKKTFAFLNFFSFAEKSELFENVRIVFHPPTDYVYDGISIAIESIIRFGPDAEAIRNGFRELNYIGVTGKIRFDNLGNRLIE
jgi:hypothetical protein